MIVDIVLLALFSLGVLGLAYRIARLDALYASFIGFFWIYTIFAMVGYRFFPILSQAFNAYFGGEVYNRFLIFVAASFASFAICARWLQPVLVGTRRFTVSYRPRAVTRWVALIAAVFLVVYMSVTLAVIYPAISYSRTPQIPNTVFAILFKNTPFAVLIIWAFARRHPGGGLERVSAWMLVAALVIVFLLTALKSGNRTDILALLLGVSWYELSPFLLDQAWKLRVQWSKGFLRTVCILFGGAALAWVLMESVRGSREPTSFDTVPAFARILGNDYYAPAHILFASLAYDYVRPMLVLKSNIANALLLGGVLDVPYLQTEVGNLLLPGSSSRSTGFAYFIFTEGFMAGGLWLGVLYNGLVPVACIALWRRLGRSTDIYYNGLVGALCAMSLATVSRSGVHLILRIYLFSLLPFLFIFRSITGARFHAEGGNA